MECLPYALSFTLEIFKELKIKGICKKCWKLNGYINIVLTNKLKVQCNTIEFQIQKGLAHEKLKLF